MRCRLRVLIGLSLLLVTPLGCSISASMSASSESFSASSKSSSDSSESSKSSSESRTVEYQADVRDYTEAYVRSGGDFNKFMSGLGQLASKHGITNWEADSTTYVGIGQGLKKAKVTATQLDVYKTNLSRGDPGKASSIQQGYDSQD